MMTTRRRFMEGTIQAAMLSLLSSRALAAQKTVAESESYALNPVFEYLQTWNAPSAVYSPDQAMVLKYDMINWMAPGGGGTPKNRVVGTLTISRRRREGERLFLRFDCACEQDRWVAEVTCLDDVWNTPEEWTFSSEPTSPNPDCQNLVGSALKGVRKNTELELTWNSGRKKMIPASGALMFPLALLGSPEKWPGAAAAMQPVHALRELYYLMPDQHFVADGSISLKGGTALNSFLQYGPAGIPLNYVSGPTGLPLAMTGFLISYVLTDAEIGGVA